MWPTDDRPWSLAALTILSLFCWPGAIVLSVRNLQYLGVYDEKTARFYAWATAAFLASLLLLTWSFDPKAFEKTPEQQALPITLLSPLVCYLIQVIPFRRWRLAHPAQPTRPWYSSILPAIVTALATIVVALAAISIVQVAMPKS